MLFGKSDECHSSAGAMQQHLQQLQGLHIERVNVFSLLCE